MGGWIERRGGLKVISCVFWLPDCNSDMETPWLPHIWGVPPLTGGATAVDLLPKRDGGLFQINVNVTPCPTHGLTL